MQGIAKKFPTVAKALGISGYTADSFDKNYARRQKEGAAGMGIVTSAIDSGNNRMVQGFMQAQGAVADAAKKSGGIWTDQWKAFWDGLISKNQGSAGAAAGGGDGGGYGSPRDLEKSHYKPECTSLAKMGFVFKGAGVSLTQETKRGADGIWRLVEHFTTGNGQKLDVIFPMTNSV